MRWRRGKDVLGFPGDNVLKLLETLMIAGPLEERGIAYVAELDLDVVRAMLAKLVEVGYINQAEPPDGGA